MIVCYNCGTENQDTEVYCYHCGVLLRQDEGGNTNTLSNETDTVNQKRQWGTARFDVDTVLKLDPRDYDAPPLRVSLHTDMVLGRSHGDYVPDIDLAPFEAYERGVSRQHASIRRQNDTVTITDNNSANNTFLNGQRLVPNQPRILRDGDEIRLGQLVLRVNFEDELQK